MQQQHHTRPTRRTFAAAAVAACIGSTLAWTGTAYADPVAPTTDSAEPAADAPQFPTEWQMSAEGTELTGVAPSASIDVDIAPGWAPIGDGRLTLSYDTGQTVSGSLSIFVNGSYLQDVTIEPGGDATDVDIPSDTLTIGRNTIEVISSIDLASDGECRRLAHPGRRLELDDATSFDIELAPVEIAWADAMTAMLPTGTTDRRVDVHTVGPLRSATLSNASSIVAALFDEPAEDFDVAVVNHDADAFSFDVFDSTVPSILVGTRDDLVLTNFGGDADEPGFLSLIRGDDSQPILIVSGIDDAGIDAATQALTSPARRATLVDPESGVAAPVSNSVAAAPTLTSTIFSLDDLDYPNRTLTGPGRDSTTYGFDLDIASMPDAAEIRVDAQLSSSTGVSAVGVVVNGVRVGVATFGADGTTGDSVLTVRGDVLRPGRNLVRLEADFVDSADDCAAPIAPQSVTISADTTIQLGDATGSVALDLDHLPYTFRSAADTAALTVVVPDDATTDEITSGVLIANLLGSTGSTADIALHQDLADGALSDRHLVVLGTIGDAAVDVVLAGRGQAAPSGTGSNVRSDDDRATGEIQLVVRHDAPERLALVLTGADRESTGLASAALTEIGLRSDLSGSSAFIEAHPEDVRVIVGELAVVSVSEQSIDLTPDSNDPAQADNSTASSSTSTSSPGAAVVVNGDADAVADSSPWTTPLLLLGAGAITIAAIVIWRRRLVIAEAVGH